MALVPFLTSAVLIDPTSTDTKGVIGGRAGSGGISPIYAPILHNGNLYTILEGAGSIFQFTPTGGIFAYRSSDQGGSWTVLDSANGPSRTDETPSGGIFFDGDHSLIVAWTPTGGPIVGHRGPINLQNFDMDSETWGPVYGTVSSPSVWQVGQAFQRPDGSLIVFATPNNVSGNLRGCDAHIFSGGTWGASVACDVNLSGGNVSTGNYSAVMDDGGNVHLFIVAQAGAVSELFYQLVKADNTLGAFAVIQTGSPNLPGLEFSPAISGDNVVVGLVSDNGLFPTIAVGTPLSAPSFTTLGSPGIDPNLPGGFNKLLTPVIAADDTGIYAAYFIRNTDFVIRTAFSPNVNTPLTGWTTSIQSFDSSTSAGDPTSWDFLGIRRDSGNLFGAAITAIDSSGRTPTMYWLGSFAPAPPPVITPASTAWSAGGGPYVVPRPCKCDIGDLAHEALARMAANRREWPYRASFPPRSAIRVTAQKLIPIPTVAAGITEGLAYTVDQGFIFALEALVVEPFAGAVNPGDFIWSLDLNSPVGVPFFQGAPIQGFTRVDVGLGSTEFAWPLERAELFQPNDTIRSKFTNVALPDGAPNFFKTILLGWRWPVTL